MHNSTRFVVNMKNEVFNVHNDETFYVNKFARDVRMRRIGFIGKSAAAAFDFEESQGRERRCWQRANGEFQFTAIFLSFF